MHLATHSILQRFTCFNKPCNQTIIRTTEIIGMNKKYLFTSGDADDYGCG